MIRLPKELREKVIACRDKFYEKMQAATPIVDSAKESGWASRPCPRYTAHNFVEQGYDIGPDATDLAELDALMSDMNKEYPGCLLDAKCGILFTKEDMKDFYKLHDHSKGIDS
jgi:hypothetical protein